MRRRSFLKTMFASALGCFGFKATAAKTGAPAIPKGSLWKDKPCLVYKGIPIALHSYQFRQTCMLGDDGNAFWKYEIEACGIVGTVDDPRKIRDELLTPRQTLRMVDHNGRQTFAVLPVDAKNGPVIDLCEIGQNYSDGRCPVRLRVSIDLPYKG